MNVQVREQGNKFWKFIRMIARVVGNGGRKRGRLQQTILLLLPLFYVMIGFVSIDKGQVGIVFAKFGSKPVVAERFIVEEGEKAKALGSGIEKIYYILSDMSINAIAKDFENAITVGLPDNKK